MFGSVALMLRLSLGREKEAAAVESAIDRVLERGIRTPDLASGPVYRGPDEQGPRMVDLPEEIEVGTAEMTRAVLDELGAASSREHGRTR
jgi:isocitrate/isopropylmalate dehydrogenase